MRVLGMIGLTTVLALPVWASEPGEPLDCSDWISVAPGFSCSQLAPDGGGGSILFYRRGGALMVVDNAGAALILKREGIGTCGSVVIGRHSLIQYSGTTETVIGYIDDRCVDPSGLGRVDAVRGHLEPDPDGAGFGLNYLIFDEESGQLRFPLSTWCLVGTGAPDPGTCGAGGYSNVTDQVTTLFR